MSQTIQDKDKSLPLFSCISAKEWIRRERCELDDWGRNWWSDFSTDQLMEVRVRYVSNLLTLQWVRLHVCMCFYTCVSVFVWTGLVQLIHRNVRCVCMCVCVDRLNPSECWDRSQHRNEVNHVFRWKMVMVRDPHMDHHTHTHGVGGKEDGLDEWDVCVCIEKKIR